MRISVIIPALNEEEAIAGTMEAVNRNDVGRLVEEIVVADGGSSDSTPAVAAANGATVVQCLPAGRARQMNRGASQASGDILFFLHADTRVPEGFSQAIAQAVSQGIEAGCFRLSFGHPSPMLRLYGWLTRFDLPFLRFGDQGLFITSTAFRHLGGFREDHRVLEDNEIIRRIKKASVPFRVLELDAVTSPRRYLEHGTIRLQLLFSCIYMLWRTGMSQDSLVAFYRRRVRNRAPS